MFWGRRKREAKKEKKPEWVTVAAYSPVMGDGLADLAVAKLNDNGIPAMRVPELGLVAHATVIGASPIRVVVPPDRAEEAMEILAEDWA